MFSVPVLILISVLVGVLGSLTGLGGASILVPILVIFGIPMKEAVASTMATIIATSASSSVFNLRNKIANVRIALYLEIFTVTGAILGATITKIISPVYLYFFFAAFLLTSFMRVGIFRRILLEKMLSPSAGLDRFSRFLNLNGGYIDAVRNRLIEYRARNALLGGIGMFIAGLAAGMLGIGAGAFKVTVQENVLGLPPKVSSATSNLIIGMTALAATSVYLSCGFLNLMLMAPMVVGTAAGGIIGGRILNRVTDSFLRILFFTVVSVLIVQMLSKGIMSIWH